MLIGNDIKFDSFLVFTFLGLSTIELRENAGNYQLVFQKFQVHPEKYRCSLWRSQFAHVAPNYNTIVSEMSLVLPKLQTCSPKLKFQLSQRFLWCRYYELPNKRAFSLNIFEKIPPFLQFFMYSLMNMRLNWIKYEAVSYSLSCNKQKLPSCLLIDILSI